MFHLCIPSADNENHTKGDSPKTSSAAGPQEQMWRGSQAQAQAQSQSQSQAQAQAQAQVQAQSQSQAQAQAQAQAHPSVKLQIQPQSISQRNNTLSRKYYYQFHSFQTLKSYCLYGGITSFVHPLTLCPFY